MACANATGGQATAVATAGCACARSELVIAIRPHEKMDRGETEEAQSKRHDRTRTPAAARGQLASAAAAIGMPTPWRPLALPCGGRVVLLLVPAARWIHDSPGWSSKPCRCNVGDSLLLDVGFHTTEGLLHA
ncbi:hypothetical protein PVAP13_1KG173000 [Panicum virgatum]|uniref:Uncharacterized protein n=1 Tax=Panicum virgatum TaxID=38727 RepID=A0A8T0XQQ1_PANVG|nr:hypothetical protein PVAP13_1KG173000 [Panicum virgatum]